MSGDCSIHLVPHPLSQRSDFRLVEAGASIANHFRATGYDWLLFDGVHALVTIETDYEVRSIPREEWETTFPAHGDRIGVRVVPGLGGGGGGKDPLRTILTLAVIVAAWQVGGWVGSGTFLGMGSTFWSGVTMVAGSILVNAICPVQTKPMTMASGITSEAAGTVYSITGAQNQANLYGAIPQVFGVYRLYPPYAAEPYTEIVGENEYLRLLFACYGPVQITDIKIGDTPITDYAEVEYETREGWSTDAPVTLYTSDIHQEALSLALTHAAGWLQRRSSASVDEVNFDLAFSSGLYVVDTSSGSRTATTVVIRVQYQMVGAATWSVFPGSSQSLVFTVFTGSPAVGATVTGVTSGATGTMSALTLPGATATQTGATLFQVSEVVNGAISGAAGYVLLPAWVVGGTAQVRATSGVFQVGEQITGAVTGATADVATATDGSMTVSVCGVPFQAENVTISGGATATVTAAGDDSITISEKALAMLRKTYRLILPTRGQVDVRWYRVTADDTTGYTINTTAITAMRSVTCVDPITTAQVAPLAKIALRIKATGQLNGVVDSLNFLAKSYYRVWNGAAWNWVINDSPAWAYVHVLTGPGKKRVVADSRLDLDQFLAWETFCTTNSLTCDGVVDSLGTAFETLRNIASVGRGSYAMRDNLYSVAFDGPKTTVVQTLTPRNTWGFEGSKSFPDMPDALRIKFVNENKNYQRDEIYVYADGYSVSNASLFEDLDLWGISNPDQAWKQGRFHLADALLRPETFTVNADIENLRCTRGDRVRLAHDVLLIGLGWGRIKSVTVNGGGDVLTATADEIWTMEAGKSYSLGIRFADGTSGTYPVTTVVGDSPILTFTTPIPAASAPVGGELCFFGETGVESEDCIITKIEPASDITAKLTLRHYAPAVFDVDTEVIPPFQSKITWGSRSQRLPGAPVVDAVASDESVLYPLADGTLQPRIVVTLSLAAGILAAEYIQCQIKESSAADWRSVPSVPAGTNRVLFDNVEEGQSYDMRFRSVAETGATSAWTLVEDHTVVGKTSLPPDVTSMAIDGPNLVWSYPNPPIDLAGFWVRYQSGNNQSWDSAAPAHDGLVTINRLDISTFFGQVTFLVKAVDTGGRESSGVGVLYRDLGAATIQNQAAIQIYDPTFPGTITGGTVTGGVILADSTTAMWTTDAALMWGLSTAAMWPGKYEQIVYIADYSLTPDLANEALVVDYTATGAGLTLEYATDSPVPFWTADAEPMWTTDAALMWEGVFSGYLPFPGRLGNATAQGYRFRLTVAGSTLQGQISLFRVIVDADTIEEFFDDLDIAALGTRLPIAETYRVISNVQLTQVSDGGTARRVEVADKDATAGPMIRAYDSSNAATTATVDARIKGY